MTDVLTIEPRRQCGITTTNSHLINQSINRDKFVERLLQDTPADIPTLIKNRDTCHTGCSYAVHYFEQKFSFVLTENSTH